MDEAEITKALVDRFGVVTNINGFCQAGHFGKNTAFNAIRDGEVESYMDGNRRKVLVSSIGRYIAKRLAAGRKV